MKNLVLLLLSLIVFYSCKDGEEKSTLAPVFQKDSLVDRVSIYINRSTAIWVNPQTDSVLIMKAVTDSAAEVPYQNTWKTIVRHKSRSISDSIYSIVDDMIRHPVFSEGYGVTCYAGNFLNLSIGNKISSISATYSSIGDWKTENDGTIRLFRFLKKEKLLEHTSAEK